MASSASHSRQNSSARRQAPKRMSTTNPLEGDDPLSTRSASRSGIRSSSTQRPKSGSPAPSQRNFGFLLRPEIFHQLNEADIPASFHSDALQPGPTDTLDSLIAVGRFRAAALLAAQQLRTFTDPFKHHDIFALFFVRLTCLQVLGFHYEAAQEAKSLGDLSSAFYREAESGGHIVPWELRLLAVRLQALAFGDWRRGVVGYYELAREARHFAAHGSQEEQQEWRRRLAELGLRVGMALVEMGDFEGAARHLRSLSVPEGVAGKVNAQIALILLRLGDAAAARAALPESTENGTGTLLDALCKMADGDYDAAVHAWDELRSHASGQPGLQMLATQNLAICQVYAGNAVGARQMLQELVDGGTNAHGVLFNLATLMELTSDKAPDLKQELAATAAAHEQTSLGWERANADFKL